MRPAIVNVIPSARSRLANRCGTVIVAATSRSFVNVPSVTYPASLFKRCAMLAAWSSRDDDGSCASRQFPKLQRKRKVLLNTSKPPLWSMRAENCSQSNSCRRGLTEISRSGSGWLRYVNAPISTSHAGPPATCVCPGEFTREMTPSPFLSEYVKASSQ